MTLLSDLVLVAGGGILLYLGADWLVRGGSGLARELGVSSLVIGLTIVAYGTSLPELVVSSYSAMHGAFGIAVGNVTGSNIANLGLILGLTALVSPPKVDGSMIRREVPVLLVSAIAVPVVFLDGVLSRPEAAALLGGALAFTVWTVRSGKPPEHAASGTAEASRVRAGRGTLATMTIAGLALLVLGGKLFVDGAADGAAILGVPQRVVGLTVVAVGTSLPELATSLVAARRGESGIAVGNVVGSNIFNVLFILGATGLARPIPLPFAGQRTELIALLAVTALAALALRGDRRISRAEGTLLLLSYVAFLGALAWSGRGG